MGSRLTTVVLLIYCSLSVEGLGFFSRRDAPGAEENGERFRAGDEVFCYNVGIAFELGLMITVQSSPSLPVVELSPSYRIPLVLIGVSIPLLLLQPWVSLVIAVFGLFLLLQTVTIRLQFTETALDVYRSGRLIRSFPYQEWSNWEIFWEKFPVLFYFREVKSIHFLPILFDPKTLRSCLEQRCPKQKV